MSINSSKPDFFSFPEVRVVEASAGSGKTYALAKRYVHLLMCPESAKQSLPMRQILAITFTNKASIEMKSRIIECLINIALGLLSEEDQSDLLAPLPLEFSVMQEKAYQLMEGMIKHYNFFQVQTIDKFINSILSGCAFKIGLTANFKIKTNIQDYLHYSLDILIDQAAQDPDLAALFENFLHNYLYLENRRGWFPKKDILSIINSLFDQYNTYGRYFKASAYSTKDLMKKKVALLKLIQQLHKDLPEGVDQRFAKSLGKFLQNAQKGFDVDGLSTYFQREELPLKKNARAARSVEKLWTRIHQGIRRYCLQEAFSLFNPSVQLGEKVLEIFYDVARREDILFLSELNQRAQNLFDDDRITVPELYYRLATRFRHYLIDEFQDTSRIQWQNLDQMIEEALSTGGSLFYVGDRKQAIYSFRGGDVSLFDQIKTRFKHFNVQEDYLEVNWRSTEEIVAFNNQVFSYENLQRFILEKEQIDAKSKNNHPVRMTEADLREIEQVFRHARQSFRPKNKGGYVFCEYIDEGNKEQRELLLQEKIVQTIQELKARFNLKDIAILTRNNRQIEDLTQCLITNGLAVISERTSDINQHYLIQEICFFLRFLDKPDDNLSFALFITSELFTRATGRTKADMHDFIFQMRSELKANQIFLYEAFKERFPNVWQAFVAPFYLNAGMYPLFELMVSFYRQYQCYHLFPDSQGFLIHWLELIKKYEEEGYAIRSFLTYIDNLVGEEAYVQMADEDALHIMTVHKAKGLEFPVVIVPYLGFDLKVGMGRDNQLSYLVEQDEEGLRMVRHKKTYLKFSEDLYEIYARHYKKTFMSELNNIYVALTRPKKELYIYIPKKIGSSLNIARHLIPEALFQSGSRSSISIPAKKKKNVLSLPGSEYCNWIDYLHDEWVSLDDMRQKERRRQGEIVHFILSFIKNLKEQNLDQLWPEIAATVMKRYPSIDDIGEYEKIVKRFLACQAMHPFFYIDQGVVKNELEVIDGLGRTKRIDRLIMGPDDIRIIDYKKTILGSAQQKEQIQEYLRVMKEIYPQQPVKAYLLYWEELKVESFR